MKMFVLATLEAVAHCEPMAHFGDLEIKAGYSHQRVSDALRHLNNAGWVARIGCGRDTRYSLTERGKIAIAIQRGMDVKRQARRRAAPNSALAQTTSRESAALSPSVHRTIAE
jgi:DNA-binding transcriptional regulator PaaX